MLPATNILVCLLPLTPETRGFLDNDLFAALPLGHVGREPQLDQAALLEALDNGHLSSGIFDVTDPEPLPPGIIADPVRLVRAVEAQAHIRSTDRCAALYP